MVSAMGSTERSSGISPRLPSDAAIVRNGIAAPYPKVNILFMSRTSASRVSVESLSSAGWNAGESETESPGASSRAIADFSVFGKSAATA